MSDVKEVATPKRLMDIGTRYDHWMELIDLWEIGLMHLKKMQPQYLTAKEKMMMETLEDGISLIKRQLNLMSSYEEKQWALRDVLNKLPKDPAKIEGGRGTPLKEVGNDTTVIG